MSSREHNAVEIICPHCGAMFGVPRSMKGGIANCPECRTAVQVPGGYEPEFWLLWGLGAAFAVLVSWVAFAVQGLWAGIATLLVGALILGAVTLAS